MHNFFVRAAIVVGASLTFAGVADAAIIGPVYAGTPGMATTSSSGSAITASGATVTYSGFDLSLTDDLYWGPTSDAAVGMAMDGTINAANETLAFNSGASNLATGFAVFTGSATIPLVSGSPTYQTRMTLQVSDLANNGLGLVMSNTLGLPGGTFPVLEVLQDFKATRKFEIYNGAAWVAAGPLYDAIPGKTIASNGLRTSFGGSYFYTENAAEEVPEPAALGLLGLGVIALGARRRKR